MALYRCDACGSPNVIKDSKIGGVGFNYAKGIVGTVILGTGGAVAGVESKTEEVFVCPDCGVTLSHPMDMEMKTLVELGLRSAEARNNLRYGGVKLSWDFIKHRYKNLEDGIADEIIKAETEERERSNNEIIEKAKETIKRVDEMLESYSFEENTDELQQKWQEEMKKASVEWENNYNAFKKSCDDDLEKEFRKKCDEKIDETEKQLKDIMQKESDLKTRLSKLNFLAFLFWLKLFERIKVKKEFEKIQKKKSFLQRELVKYKSYSVDALDAFTEARITEAMERKKRDMIREYIAINPKPESPYEKRNRMKVLKEMRERSLTLGTRASRRQIMFYIYVVLDAMDTDISRNSKEDCETVKAVLSALTGLEKIDISCLVVCSNEENADYFVNRNNLGIHYGINFDNYLLY